VLLAEIERWDTAAMKPVTEALRAYQRHRQATFFVVETLHVVHLRKRFAILLVPPLSAGAGLCVDKTDATSKTRTAASLPGGFFVTTV
jgi:hypothetical protein